MNKVSIIIPVYNTSKEYLENCFNSAINQTYENIEIIIIDDGSKNDIAKICDDFSKNDYRIKVFHQINKGISEARNAGIRYSTGDWIYFLDSDDWLEKNAIEKIIPNEECEIVISRAFSCKNNERELIVEKYDDLKCIIDEKEKRRLITSILVVTQKTSTASVWGKLYNKSFLINNKIKFCSNLKFGEDGVFNIKAYTYSKKTLLIKDATYNYRINENSVMHSFSKECLEYVEKLINEYHNDVWQIIYNKYLSEYYYFVIWHLNYVFIRYAFHKDLNITRKERIQIVKKIASEKYFSEAIHNVDIFKLKMRKRILVILLKMRLYYLIPLIYKV